MFQLLVLLAVLTSPASPLPSPSASASPLPALHEIVHIRASELCSEFATHANSAIDSAVNNDAAIAATINALQHSNLSLNGVAFENNINALETAADGMARNWRGGQREAKLVHDLAAKTSDPEEKKELTAAADALSGALYRQHMITRDLDGFVSFLQADQMATLSDGQKSAFEATTGSSDPINHPVSGNPNTDSQLYGDIGQRPTDDIPFPGQARGETYDQMAAAAAKDFSARVPSIALDELTAAVHIEQASGGC